MRRLWTTTSTTSDILYVMNVIDNKFLSKGKLSFDRITLHNEQLLNNCHTTILTSVYNLVRPSPTFGPAKAYIDIHTPSKICTKRPKQESPLLQDVA